MHCNVCLLTTLLTPIDPLASPRLQGLKVLQSAQSTYYPPFTALVPRRAPKWMGFPTKEGDDVSNFTETQEFSKIACKTIVFKMNQNIEFFPNR